MKRNPEESDEAVLSRQAFGRQMWENKVHGTCGSSAALAATVYRAAGLPARIVSLSPSLDTWLQLISPSMSIHRGFANHFVNEVFVGGQWVRVNYRQIRSGVIVRGMGPMIREHAFADFSQVDYAGTWGHSYAGPGAGKGSPNPYSALAISDREPVHKPLVPAGAGLSVQVRREDEEE